MALNKSILIVFILFTQTLCAQHDSTYYTTYDRLVTGRFYFSQKYTQFIFSNTEQGVSQHYKPNTTLNMGIGATYKWATLNLAYGFDFLNPDTDKGKTRYLDLQFYGYGKRFVIQGLGQFYKGFYLDNEAVTNALGKYYQRPDLTVYELGLSAQYVLNHRRFTYRASFFQSEWQKRSSGSFLLGAELYFGQLQADSTIVPGIPNKTAAQNSIQQMGFGEIGPNVGYAYTLVVKKHFFVTGSATASYTYGINTVKTIDIDDTSTGFGPNTQLKIFAGYNSELWALSITYANSQLITDSKNVSRHTEINTGNVRFNIVRRFDPGEKVKKIRKLIDDVER